MIKYSGIYESSTPPPSTKALWVDGGVLKIYKNGSWRPVDDPKSKLTIDSILKAGSTNPVENRAIHSRFIGVDKDIEVNRNNIAVLTGRVDEVNGIAKGAEELTKVNEERLNSVQATANTALENSERNQDSVRNAQVTANEAKALVEGLTTVVRRAENDISQLKELNVVYPNNIRNLTTESTVAEVKEAFIPAIGGMADRVNTPHVGYLIKGVAYENSLGYGPDSTIISVDIIRTDNKNYHKFIYIDNNTAIISVTVDLVNYRLIDKSTLANIEATSKVGTLRDLYISAGAKYNETTGFYELNGLTDITEEQMRVIYKYAGTPQTKAAFAYSKARTNLPMPGMYNGSVYGAMFYGCTNLEVANLGNRQSLSPSSYDVPLVYTEGNSCFYLCKKLKKIYGKIYQRNIGWDLTFGDCLALEEVRIAELYSSIQLSWSPNLSKESVQYMITNAKPPSGAAAGSIAITLHPTAYARLKDDADIVAALEAKGGIVTLVSA